MTGTQLQEIMDRHGLTRAALAACINVTETAVRNWQAQGFVPDLTARAIKLAEMDGTFERVAEALKAPAGTGEG
jgi:DNA-binding transcriptional regulator YiaG